MAVQSIKRFKVFKKDFLILFGVIFTSGFLGLACYRYVTFRLSRLDIIIKNESQKSVDLILVKSGDKLIYENANFTSKKIGTMKVYVPNNRPVVISVKFKNRTTIEKRILGYVDPPLIKLPRVEVVIKSYSIDYKVNR